MAYTYLLILPLLLILHTTYQVIYNLFFHPLHDLPGPLLYRAFDFPFTIPLIKGRAHRNLLALHNKYGPVVRVGPNEVSHISGDIWREVYGHNATKGAIPEFPKATGSSFVPYNGYHGFLTSPRLIHRRYRALFSHAFSQQGLLAQEGRVLGWVEKFMATLKRRVEREGGPDERVTVDFVDWFNWLTMDIIGDLAFGESFECLDKMRAHGWVNELLGSVQLSVAFQIIEKYGLLNVFFLVMPKRLKEVRRKNYAFSSEKIDRRVANTRQGVVRGDFLDTVLAKPLDDPEKVAFMEQGERYLSLPELKSVSSNFVLAGSETTATLLSGCVYQLLRNPTVHQKLVKEIREVFKSADDITISTANDRSPYLLQVLSEALRIYPPVPMIVARQVPSPGMTVMGRFYPAGTGLRISSHAANLSARNFARPLEFIPERWAPKEERPNEFVNDNSDGAYQPFSNGPRNCLGRNLAYAEQRIILAKLLWSFDLSTTEGREAEMDSWAEKQKGWVLWEKSPLWADVSLRPEF